VGTPVNAVFPVISPNRHPHRLCIAAPRGRPPLRLLKANRSGDIHQHRGIPDVPVVHKVGFEQGVVDALAPGLRFRPFRHFLSQPAVVGVGARPVRQPFGVHQGVQTRLSGPHIDIAAAEQLLDRPACAACRDAAGSAPT